MDTREAFEAGYGDEELLRRHPDGSYMHRWLNDEWAGFQRGWQAAIAHAVPENCVVVPKEPTEDMVEAGRNTPCIDTGNYEEDAPEDYRVVYRAMIAAAPKGETK